MALKEKLQSDLTQSMRDRNELRSGTIRMVLTAIKNEEVSGKEARELSDAEVITVLSEKLKRDVKLLRLMSKQALKRELISKRLRVKLSPHIFQLS